MSQWGDFLDIYGRTQADADNAFSDLWDTAVRGIDPYVLAPYLDSCHFITVPVTPDGYPNAYVGSCQHSMMRVMNEGKQLVGGIYWGRFIYNDLYAFLTPAEMIDQVLFTQMDSRAPVSNIVLMGIGEPLDNFETVLRFLTLVNHPEGLNIGMRHISLSTCGLVGQIDKLAGYGLQLTLSVSLHAPDDETRSRIMPVNQSVGVEKLMETCRRYFEKPGGVSPMSTP